MLKFVVFRSFSLRLAGNGKFLLLLFDWIFLATQGRILGSFGAVGLRTEGIVIGKFMLFEVVYGSGVVRFPLNFDWFFQHGIVVFFAFPEYL